VRALLDTGVLLGPKPDLGDADVAISAISLAELHFGVLVARTEEHAQSNCAGSVSSTRPSTRCPATTLSRESTAGSLGSSRPAGNPGGVSRNLLIATALTHA
jgi:toxin FitB